MDEMGWQSRITVRRLHQVEDESHLGSKGSRRSFGFRHSGVTPSNLGVMVAVLDFFLSCAIYHGGGGTENDGDTAKPRRTRRKNHEPDGSLHERSSRADHSIGTSRNHSFLQGHAHAMTDTAPRAVSPQWRFFILLVT